VSNRGDEARLLELVNPGLREIKPYVPGKSIEEARQGLSRRGFVKMASNENPLGTSPRAARALARSRRRCFQYPESTGRALRAALARRFELQPEQIVLGNGADGILYTLAMTLIAEADQALIPEVTFSLYRILVQAMRGQVVTTAMKEYRPDLDDMTRRIGPRTKCLFICNPNNPTGALIPRQEVEAFVKDLPPHVVAIYDEVYFDFTQKPLLPDVLEPIRRGQSNLVVVRSFSKIYGLAGVRLGYAVAAPKLIELMHRVRPPFDVSVPALAAGRAALDDVRFYERTLALTRTEMQTMSRRLTEMGLSPVPSHTNFLLVDVGRDGLVVAERLLEEGYIVRAGLGAQLDRHIRITLGTRRHNRGLIKALERVIR
jgi:histidinol-phosphate aminotransferase